MEACRARAVRRYEAGSAARCTRAHASGRHPGEVSTSEPRARSAASRASWPGALVERALTLVATDYRRPIGPVVLAGVLAVAAGLESGKSAGPIRPDVALLLGLLATAPLAVIRRYPGPAIGIVLTASAGFVVFGRLSWSVAAVAGWLVALAACPVMLPRRAAILAIGLTEVAVLLGVAGLHGNATPWDATAAEALAVLAAWGAGEMLRARRQSTIDQAAVAERVRDLSERDVVARERASIARELHDVVAHHVSMIAVRSATAPYAMPGLSPEGQDAFAEIAEEARAALTELRVVLGVLRSPDGPRPDGARAEAAGPDARPQPRIADLDDLLARVASAGTNATLSVCGQSRQLPGSVELCCYRIVQEALTNVGRHAQGSQVRVQVCYDAAALRVLVSNDPPPQRRPQAGPAVIGYGLTGLRERVAMLRGEFRAGPDSAGGFAVQAMLPVPGEAEPDGR